MFERRKIKCCILLVLTVMVALHLHIGYFCIERGCVLTTESRKPDLYLENEIPYTASVVDRATAPHHPENAKGPLCASNQDGGWSLGKASFRNMTTTDLDESYRFDLEGQKDVFVFLHMQKTGGTTFGRHLINNLEMTKPCTCLQGKKKCDCMNSNGLVWLVSRFSTGWRCGLHADWTELTTCVDGVLNKIEGFHRDRRYMYITILRDPYTRYLSEFKHVQRGATWKAVRLQCDGRQASLLEVPFCFDGANWTGVSLDAFMHCPHNLANNRQTRMLANLSMVGCYSHFAQSDEPKQCRMLKSAKDNLRNMAFFGLTEYQLETQYMFEKIFGLKFKKDFFQYNHTHSSEVALSPTQRSRLYELNKLDIELYEYAKKIFFQRLQALRKADSLHPDQVNVNINSRTMWDPRHDEYEEGDEDDAEDDDEYNNRITHKYANALQHKRFLTVYNNIGKRQRDKHKKRIPRRLS